MTLSVGVPLCSWWFQPAERESEHSSPTGRDVHPHCGPDEWCVDWEYGYAMCYLLNIVPVRVCTVGHGGYQEEEEGMAAETIWQYKLENLFHLRDSLMATASIYMMETEDCRGYYEKDGDPVCNSFHHSLLVFLLPHLIHTAFLYRLAVWMRAGTHESMNFCILPAITNEYCVMQSLLLDPKMNIGCIVPITDEFELWDPPPMSHMTKNKLSTKIKLNDTSIPWLRKCNNECLLLD